VIGVDEPLSKAEISNPGRQNPPKADRHKEMQVGWTRLREGTHLELAQNGFRTHHRDMDQFPLQEKLEFSVEG